MRLFTAIEIPETVRTRLSFIQCAVQGARWVPPENLHLTLRFIGEVDSRAAEEIDSALARIKAKPFSLRLQSVGLFGAPPRVLWAGLERSEPLYHLADKIGNTLTRMGVDLDRRRFSPHVTLAKLHHAAPDAVKSYLATHGDFTTEPFEVSRFVLYSSYLSQSGAIYTPERYYLF